jgi:glutamate formiminotransferase
MLIECIPNVSEGRRTDIIAAMAAAIRGIPGVRLLDHSSIRRTTDPCSRWPATRPASSERAGVVERAVADVDLATASGIRGWAPSTWPFVPMKCGPWRTAWRSRRSVPVAARSRSLYLYEASTIRPQEPRGYPPRRVRSWLDADSGVDAGFRSGRAPSKAGA